MMLNKRQLTALWESVAKTVYAQAWEWSAKSGKPFDDFVGEGHAVFMRCASVFDASRGCAFNSFFHGCLHNAFVGLIQRQDVPGHGEADMDLVALEGETGKTERIQFVCPDPSFRLRLHDWVATLSAEAATVIRLLLDSPTEMANILGSDGPKAMRGKITLAMRHKLGWSWPVIWKTHHEIQNALGEL